MKLLRLKIILCSFVRVLFYKLLYNRNLYVSKMILGSSSEIYLDDNNSYLYIEENFSCRSNVKIRAIGGTIKIGKNSFLNDNCGITCRKKITIGDNCLFGHCVYIYDHDHVYKTKGIISKQGFNCEEIKIGNNVWVGANTVILQGVTIGDNVVIGAGSIINKDIPSGTLFYNKRQQVSTPIDLLG